MAAANHLKYALFRYASGVNLTHANQFVAAINNSLSNLGSPTSDFNYGAWGTYVAVSPLSGFKTSLYEGGIRPPAIIKAPQSLASSPTYQFKFQSCQGIYICDRHNSNNSRLGRCFTSFNL